MTRTRVRIPSTVQQRYEAFCYGCGWVHMGSGAHQAAREHCKAHPDELVEVISNVVTQYRAEVTS